LKIAIGPVFNEYGGVSKHIMSIKKFSYHDIRELPPSLVRTALNRSRIRGGFLYRIFLERVGLSKYDILHSHVNPWFTKLCLSTRKTGKCKWVHTYHTLCFEKDQPNGLTSLHKKINKSLLEVASRADIKISVSKWLHDYLLENYFIQTEIVENGVDMNACNKADPNRFSNKFGLRDFALFVGNIQPEKNPKLFVDLARKLPETRFVMIGRKLNSKNLTKECGTKIPRNITIMGEMKHEDVLDAIAACKALVMTSKREGTPTVLLEAMAMSKPVVAPAHTGCREIIQSKRYGFMYQPKSVEELVEKTENALADKHVGKRARERIAQKYDWNVLIKKIDSVYES